MSEMSYFKNYKWREMAMANLPFSFVKFAFLHWPPPCPAMINVKWWISKSPKLTVHAAQHLIKRSSVWVTKVIQLALLSWKFETFNFANWKPEFHQDQPKKITWKSDHWRGVVILPMESISSMKIMAGALAWAFSNIFRTLPAPTPTNISSKPEPDNICKWAVSKKPDPGPRTSLRFANWSADHFANQFNSIMTE